jgi:hypothetical protein
MAAGEQHPLTTILTADIAASGAAVTTSVTVRAPFAGTVTGVSYVPVAAITGANTNSRTLSAINHFQNGAGSTAVATLAMISGVNAAAFDEKAITLTASATDKVVAAGDIIELKSLSVGSGIADPGGQFLVSFARA